MKGVLNNKRLATLLSCLINVILTFSGFAVFSLFDLNKWTGVGIGGGILIVCAIIAIIVKKKSYLFVTLINAVAVGIAISSLYTHFNFSPPVWQTALVAIGTAIIFCVFLLLTKTPLFKRHYVICGIVFLTLVLTAEILCMVFVSPYVFGFALFLFMTLAGHVLSLSSSANNFDELIKNLTICSFTVLILAVIIVILIISQGDGADGLGDFLSGASPTRAKRRKLDPYNFELLKY